MYTQIVLVLMISLVAILIASVLNNYLKRRIKKSMEDFIKILKESKDTNEKIDLDRVDFEEFSKIAKYTNELFDKKT